MLSGDIAEDRVGVNVVDVVMGVSSVFSVVWAVMWVEVCSGLDVVRFGVLWEGITVDASVSLVESDSRFVEVSEGVLKLSDVALTLEGDIVEAVTTAVTCELSETVTKVVRLEF